MKIDLKSKNLTVEDVRKLIASKDDSRHRQIRVTTDGILFLSDDVAHDNLEGILFRMETLDRGNDYVGEAAAGDERWILRVYEAIKKNWPAPVSSYIGDF